MSNDAATSMTVSSVISSKDTHSSKRDLPRTTVGTTVQHCESASSLVSHAMLPNVMWSLFFLKDGIDKTGTGIGASMDKVLQTYHSMVMQFLASGMKSGAFIVEAGDFSACAAWWPPGSHQPPKDDAGFVELEREGKTLLAAFERENQKVRTEQIWSKYGQEFWSLGILARDPRKPVLGGAVRAVLQPFIDQAAANGKPMWLVTTSEHARNIYLHFGWQVVKTITLQGHHEWCMILYPPEQDKAI